jgi:hypothetical protein
MRTPQGLFILFLISTVAGAYETGIAPKWEREYERMIGKDWNTLRAMAFTADEGKNAALARVEIKFILSTGPKDAVCEESLTPAYTIENDDGHPEIHFCMSNYGYLDAYVSGRVILSFIYPNAITIRFGKTEVEMANAYLAYLQDRLVRHRRRYCLIQHYLYFLVHENFAENCVDLEDSGKGKDEWRNWILLAFEDGYSRYSSVDPASASPSNYESYRSHVFDQYVKWSYRSVILHELGHVINGDLSGSQAPDAEIAADRSAFKIVNSTMFPDIGPVVMMHSLFFMARIIWARNANPDELVTRANEMNKLYILYSKQRPASGALVFSAFTNALVRNGTITYGRHLHENYDYTNNAQSTRWELRLPKTGKLLFYLPDEQVYPFLVGEGAL